MKKVYHYPLIFFKKGSAYIKRREVVRDLRKSTSFGSRRWSIPEILFHQDYELQARRFIVVTWTVMEVLMSKENMYLLILSINGAYQDSMIYLTVLEFKHDTMRMHIKVVFSRKI